MNFSNKNTIVNLSIIIIMAELAVLLVLRGLATSYEGGAYGL